MNLFSTFFPKTFYCNNYNCKTYYRKFTDCIIPSNFREEDNWLNEHNMYPRLYYYILNQLNYVYVIKLEIKER